MVSLTNKPQRQFTGISIRATRRGETRVWFVGPFNIIVIIIRRMGCCSSSSSSPAVSSESHPKPPSKKVISAHGERTENEPQPANTRYPTQAEIDEAGQGSQLDSKPARAQHSSLQHGSSTELQTGTKKAEPTELEIDSHDEAKNGVRESKGQSQYKLWVTSSNDGPFEVSNWI